MGVTNIYFDTEFTGLHKDTTLISIGLITESGKSFYAELNDFDKDIYTNKWMVDNILANTINLKEKDKIPTKSRLVNNSKNTYIFGNTKEVREELLLFLKKEKGEGNNIQFVSDCCHYDMVLLIALLVDCALDLPEWISPVCMELNNDIADYYKVSIQDAFNMSREDLLSKYTEIGVVVKHNALYDAKVIKAIYSIIH